MTALDPDIAQRLKRDANGLFAAIAQERGTGAVLMVAWMDDERWRAPSPPGKRPTSPPRGEHWVKGATSATRNTCTVCDWTATATRCCWKSTRWAAPATPVTTAASTPTCCWGWRRASTVNPRRQITENPAEVSHSAFAPLGRLSAPQYLQRLIGVGVHVDLTGDDLQHRAVGVDDERGALDGQELPSSPRLTPERRRDSAVGVGQQWVVEALRVGEPGLLVHRVRADPDPGAPRRRSHRPGRESGRPPWCSPVSSRPDRRTTRSARRPAGCSVSARCRSGPAVRTREHGRHASWTLRLRRSVFAGGSGRM